VDDGASVTLYFNGSNTPLVTLNTTNRAGYKLGLQNREGSCGGSSISAGSQTWLDYIQVVAACNLQVSTQPENQEQPLGGTAGFSVIAIGDTPLSYQWRLDATSIPDATNSQIVVSNLSAPNYGSYSVIVSNPCGSVTSTPAILYLWQDSDGDGLSDKYEDGTLRYKLISGNTTWHQAKTNAESRGGHLATITSQQEFDLINSLLGINWQNKLIWLGGTDEAQEGTWSWITGEPWSYTRWNSGEPNNAGDEDYLSMPNNLNWNDAGEQTFPNYLLEVGFYSNPNNPDTDGDGLTDGQEVNIYHTFPDVADSDQDGLSDYQEVMIYHTNPLKADTDGDGLSDGAEVNTYGTDPLNRDDDNDGLSDYVEVITYGTNPHTADSDGDGYNDYAEIYSGKNPNNINDHPAALLSAFTAIELEFITQTNQTYQIQSSTNLTTWTNFGSPITGTGNIWSNVYSTRAAGRTYYRVELVP
jgi:hypothetical protein